MKTEPYQLSLTSGLLGDSYAPLGLVRDGAEPDIDLKALIASGDCFVTLATALDTIHDSLPIDDRDARTELSRLTALLLTLQRYYEVKPKTGI